MKNILYSFKYASKGIIYAFKNELNFGIQTIIFFIVIIAGILFGITRIEWIIVLLLSSFVLSLELINTAFEVLIDLTVDDYHDFAKISKDAAAGSVFIMSLFSAVIGLFIFFPYILEWIN